MIKILLIGVAIAQPGIPLAFQRGNTRSRSLDD